MERRGDKNFSAFEDTVAKITTPVAEITTDSAASPRETKATSIPIDTPNLL